MKDIMSADYSDKPYKSNIEYLTDELRYLNLLISYFIYTDTGLSSDITDMVRSRLSEITSSWDMSIPKQNNDPHQLQKSLEELGNAIDARNALSLKEGMLFPLSRLRDIFSLNQLEEMVILFSLSPELDSRYGDIFAILRQDGIQGRYPSIDLMLNILSFSAGDKPLIRHIFDNNAPLFRYNLLSRIHIDNQPLYSSLVSTNKRIVDYILGSAIPDTILNKCAELYLNIPAPDFVYEEDVVQQVLNMIRFGFGENKGVIFYLYGDNDPEKRSVIKAICNKLGASLLNGDLSKMAEQEIPFGDIFSVFGREAALQEAIVCLEHFDTILQDSAKYTLFSNTLLDRLQAFCGVIFVIGGQKWVPDKIPQHLFISSKIKISDHFGRKQVWEHYLKKGFNLSKEVDVDVLAAKFYLAAPQIENALNNAHNNSLWEGKGGNEITKESLYNACREQINNKLSELAQKITPKYTWDDIILPTHQKNTLREICNQAKYKHIVYQKWGFRDKLSLGKGLNIIFSGPSGTGKTMAAEVIAKELNQELYKVDLSRVVSKYIGETEKNLARIFKEVEYIDAILFFDEADSLLGKRSEVKDAHDRYANIEVGYLLQKFEEHEGIIITASNLQKNIDEAFQRRMHFSIEFAPPDEEMRRMIWASVFPINAPLSEKVDFGILADKFSLNGGNIKNAALNAAFLAAADSTSIEMEHIVSAILKEYRKTGSFLPRDINEFLSKGN